MTDRPLLHPVVIKRLSEVLRDIEPGFSIRTAAEVAGDIVKRLHRKQIAVVPEVMLEPLIVASDAPPPPPQDPWERLLERELKIQESWTENGITPWNRKELH